MRKELIALGIAIAVATNCFGELLELEQGTREIGLQGNVDLASRDGRSFSVDALFGYFTANCFEIGIAGGYAENDVAETWNVGVFAELNFDLDGKLIPFIGAAAKYYGSKVTESMPTTTIVISTTTNGAGETVQTEDTTTTTETTETEDEAVVLEAKAGLKYFFAENVAFSVAYVTSFATEEIYWDDDKRQDTDARVEYAIRYFF